MKKHLVMMNGPEGRDFITERTISICDRYFDSIRIVQNGGALPFSEIVSEKVIHHSYDFLGYTQGLDILKEGIPDGDWILLIDSDERPQQALLDGLTPEICNAEREGINVLGFPFRHHTISNEGIIEDVCGHDTGFVCCRAFKVGPDLYSSVYNSAHFGFVQKNPNIHHTKLFINHYKHWYSHWLSSMSYGISYPESIGLSEENWEYGIIKTIQDKLLEEYIYTANSKQPEEITPTIIYNIRYHSHRWFKLLDIVKPFEQSTNQGCKDIVKGIEFLSKGLNVYYDHRNCGRECCVYSIQF